MARSDGKILTLNGGSSSLKFAVHSAGSRLARGKFDRLGSTQTSISTAQPPVLRSAIRDPEPT
jgi:acetate kinase